MILGNRKAGMGDKSSGRRIVGVNGADATKCSGGQVDLESMVPMDQTTPCIIAV